MDVMSQYLPAVDIYNYTPSLCVYNTPHHRHQLLLNIFKQREVRKYFYLFSFHRDKNVNISTPSKSSYLLSWVSEELLGNVFQRKQMCSQQPADAVCWLESEACTEIVKK